ncbi:MAG: hypothetical protein KJO07_23995 [Deltaproteobacteria bacterium]|nr:hypothetical protein [Deltaproteobacteria bacterium]
MRSFTVNENANPVEDTALGDSNRSYLSGLADVDGTIECHFDHTDATGQEAMTQGSTVSLVLYPKGTTSGDPTFTVSATILGIASSATFNEVVSRTFTWAAAGAGTWGTVV